MIQAGCFENRVCLRCNIEYAPTGSKQRFCPQCGILNESDQRKRYRQAHPYKHDCYQARRSKFKKCGLDESSMLAIIARGCPICGESFKLAPHLDHDHRICSGKNHICMKCFRGVICDICNTGFIRAIEQRPALRKLVAPSVLAYIDKLMEEKCLEPCARLCRATLPTISSMT